MGELIWARRITLTAEELVFTDAWQLGGHLHAVHVRFFLRQIWKKRKILVELPFENSPNPKPIARNKRNGPQPFSPSDLHFIKHQPSAL